jgi:hypothetical protein
MWSKLCVLPEDERGGTIVHIGSINSAQGLESFITGQTFFIDGGFLAGSSWRPEADVGN